MPTLPIRTGRAQGQPDRKETGLGGGLDTDAVVGLTEFKFTLHGAHQKRAPVWKAIVSQCRPTSWRLSCREGGSRERRLFLHAQRNEPVKERLTGVKQKKKRKQALHGASSHVSHFNTKREHSNTGA